MTTKPLKYTAKTGVISFFYIKPELTPAAASPPLALPTRPKQKRRRTPRIGQKYPENRPKQLLIINTIERRKTFL